MVDSTDVTNDCFGRYTNHCAGSPKGVDVKNTHGKAQHTTQHTAQHNTTHTKHSVQLAMAVRRATERRRANILTRIRSTYKRVRCTAPQGTTLPCRMFKGSPWDAPDRKIYLRVMNKLISGYLHMMNSMPSVAGRRQCQK